MDIRKFPLEIWHKFATFLRPVDIKNLRRVDVAFRENADGVIATRRYQWVHRWAGSAETAKSVNDFLMRRGHIKLIIPVIWQFQHGTWIDIGYPAFRQFFEENPTIKFGKSTATLHVCFQQHFPTLPSLLDELVEVDQRTTTELTLNWLRVFFDCTQLETLELRSENTHHLAMSEFIIVVLEHIERFPSLQTLRHRIMAVDLGDFNIDGLLAIRDKHRATPLYVISTAGEQWFFHRIISLLEATPTWTIWQTNKIFINVDSTLSTVKHAYLAGRVKCEEVQLFFDWWDFSTTGIDPKAHKETIILGVLDLLRHILHKSANLETIIIKNQDYFQLFASDSEEWANIQTTAARLFPGVIVYT